MLRRLTILLLIVGCGTEPEDCAGVAGGSAELDNCNVCDTDLTNDCVPDCAGVWGGESVDDCNGVCNGDAVVLWGICIPASTTSIDLSGSGLTGEIPSEIGNLTNLTDLELGDNQLTGQIPVEIGNLNDLTVLDLSDNQLTGLIPPEIGNLTSLLYLRLNNNQLKGRIPQEVCDLIESNNLYFSWILDGNNLTNTCE